MESWPADLDTRERVRKIALSLTEPRSVNWIKEEADVASWDTTRDELDRLVEFGQVQRTELQRGETTQYRYGPNYRRRYLDRVDELVTEHSKAELRDELAAIQEQVESWMQTYGVESTDELEASLSDADLSSQELRERNEALRRWERTASTRRLLEHALSLYDDLEEVDGTDGSTVPDAATRS